MDLTLKYMELQGTLGYLHKVDRKNSFNYVLAYSTEGSVMEYTYFESPDEAEEAVIHWGKTGDLILESFNLMTGRVERMVKHPTTVRLLEAIETYRRKNYPPEAGELPW